MRTTEKCGLYFQIPLILIPKKGEVTEVEVKTGNIVWESVVMAVESQLGLADVFIPFHHRDMDLKYVGDGRMRLTGYSGYGMYDAEPSPENRSAHDKDMRELAERLQHLPGLPDGFAAQLRSLHRFTIETKELPVVHVVNRGSLSEEVRDLLGRYEASGKVLVADADPEKLKQFAQLNLMKRAS